MEDGRQAEGGGHLAALCLDTGHGASRVRLVGTRPKWLVIALVLIAQGVFTYAPLLQGVLATTARGLPHLGLAVAAAVLVCALVEIEQAFINVGAFRARR